MANFILSAFSDEYCDDIIGQAKALSFHNIEYVELRHANGKNVIDMGNEDIILEKEMDIPEDWESNVIFIKDGKGNTIELDVPDDEEGG